MPKPPRAMEVRALNIEATVGSILAPSPSPTQDLEGRLPHLSLQERSPQSEPYQLSLLALLEKSLEPALRIEAVPVDVTVGYSEKFYLIHQESGLRVPGQFSRCEAEEILRVTAPWAWQVDLKTHEPACRHSLLCLLKDICKPQKPLEVVA